MKQWKMVQISWAFAVLAGLAILISFKAGFWDKGEPHPNQVSGLKAGFWDKGEPHPNQVSGLKLTALPKTPIAMISWEEKRTVWYWRSPKYGGLKSVLKLQWAEVPTEEDEKTIQALLVEMAKKQLRIARSEKIFYSLEWQSEDKKDWTVKIAFTSDFPSKYRGLRLKPPTWVEFDDGGRYPSK